MVETSSYQDKVVLVTGGASGLGLALVEAFSSAGAKVFVADIVEEGVNSVVTRLTDSGAICKGIRCDVTEIDDVEIMLDRAWTEVGPVDVLCNNAGVVKTGKLLEATQEDIEWQFGVNVWGVLNVNRAYVRRLRDSALPGHILITGSEHCLTNPGYTQGFFTQVYTMSKHAVLAMADVIRGELRDHDIGISVLCPGAIATDMAQSSARSRPTKFGGPVNFESQSPSGEVLGVLAERTKSPEEVAAIAIEGINKQLFVIPTHLHMREDVAARYQEIDRSFELLQL